MNNGRWETHIDNTCWSIFTECCKYAPVYLPYQYLQSTEAHHILCGSHFHLCFTSLLKHTPSKRLPNRLMNSPHTPYPTFLLCIYVFLWLLCCDTVILSLFWFVGSHTCLKYHIHMPIIFLNPVSTGWSEFTLPSNWIVCELHGSGRPLQPDLCQPCGLINTVYSAAAAT